MFYGMISKDGDSDVGLYHADNLTVALNIFRITLALIFGTLVPMVTKPYFRSIQSSKLYDQRVDRIKKWLRTSQFISISGPLPVKLPPKNFFPKILLHQTFRIKISVGVSWAISELSRSFPPLSPF